MGYANKNAEWRSKLIMDILYQYTTKEEARFYRIIMNQKIEKIKEIHDFWKNRKIGLIITLKNFNVKGITFEEVPYNTVEKKEYIDFMSRATWVYMLYDSLKDSKSFEELISKAKELTSQMMEGLRGEEKYFNDFKPDFDRMYLSYFRLYIVSKWLNLKPNKEFKIIFNKCEKMLK
ncbi:MAG: hypothetical protein PHT91_01085 [Candidatus Nanoarchaeia archaeon]|nr:hypothetical protein [Candidatus Nanoarchaeia archaeon]